MYIRQASAKQSQFRQSGQSCQTNPICTWAENWRGKPHRTSRLNCVKQSQFPAGPHGATNEGQSCKTKPNLGRMGPLGDGTPGRGQWRKTKPIRAEAAWDEAPGVWDAGQSCETNPIPAAGKKWQVLCERGVMVNCSVHRPRQNKANLAITAGIRKRIVPNEANLRSSGRPDGPGSRHRIPATPKDWRAVYRRVT